MITTRNKIAVMVFFVLLIIFWGEVLADGQGIKSITRIDPYYPAPPYQYRNNQIVTFVFTTTPEILGKLVPAPMVPLPSNIMFFYIGRLNVQFGEITFDYHEAGLGIPVMLKENFGNYAVVLYLDEALGIVPGREIYGFPKKDSRIEFSREDGIINFKLERLDVTIASGSMKLMEEVSPESQTPALPWFNLKIIPSVLEGAGPEVKQITSVPMREDKSHRMFKGTGTLNFHSSEFDILGNIPVVKIMGVRYSEGDFVLGYGQVLHDYLAEGKNP